MREKLSAAGLGLLVAAIVAVSASFAWITLSRAPEVTGIATTLSGNGSLEIALSKADGSQPEEYDIDENAPAKTDVVSSNLQWGNLVNLSDESYGIDNLALRPAQLNTANLLNSPLWGASYGEDGRITQLDSNYAYAKYKDGSFMTSKELGVRAIATYTTTISEGSQAEYVRVRDAVTAAHNAVNTAYGNERSGVAAKFGALGTMISKYAQDKLNKASPGTNLAPYLKDMIPLYETVQGVMEKQKEAYVALANLQSYLHANNTNTEYTPLTWKDLDDNKENYNAQDSKTDSKNGVVSLVGLKQFIDDLGVIEKDVALLYQYKADYEQNGTAYYWSSWNKTAELGYPLWRIVDDLIDYRNMTIDLNDDGKERKVVSLGSSDASALLNANGKERKVYVYGGVLKRLEQTAVDETYRINGRAECTISVSYLFATITIKGKAYTKASGASDFSLNFTKSTEGKGLVPSDEVAEDTYGMVVDFWVRTNHETTKLTLEGATVLNESGEVLRYDGVNRIWGVTGDTEDGTLTRESTTQGGGSCYVYYADTPEDQSRSLRLLEAMKVAFVSANGELLAQGEMDTQNYWAQNGRITVPMVLDSETKTTYTYTDEKNEEKIGRAITTLHMDDAQRITAIIYLDGTQLTNDMVLAASEIQGQLNLQFGSSENLKTVGDKNLVDKVRRVTATASKTELDYDKATSDEELMTEITLTVEGAEPKEVTARFVRAINATQGSREPEMPFVKLEDGTWTKEYKFEAPGTYYLRHVRLDGVDYALENPVSIQVKGFDLKDVGWGETVSEASVRTSDGTYSEKVWVEFATNDERKMPNTVEARFVRTDGNTVNIPLSRDTNGVWRGTGTFTTSGVYKWEYLVYKTTDSATGIYKDMGDSKKTLDLALGLYVGVTDKSGTQTQPYEERKTYDKNVAVRIYDNAGNTLEGLTGAKLFYSNGGSASNTINTDLTWNELDSCYDGTLPIVRAGRYQFAYVAMQGGQTLTKAMESPVYTIISPDPPIYDENSQTTYHGDTIQFVPLTNDAQIDGIKILNSASAKISAVVYNSVTREYYTVGTSDVRYAGDSWTVKLPAYEHDIGDDKKEKTQDGTWSLVALWLMDCYDAESNFRNTENPIIWVGSDDVSKDYASTLVDANGSKRPYESKDFSKLSTTVSCSVSITMTPGTTALGDKTSTEFMHPFAVKNLGMSVAIRDNTGNEIPSDKIESVKLSVDYTAPADDTYGYKVQSGFNRNCDVNFAWDSEGRRVWTADSADIWQYVGEYRVQGLTVTVKGGKSLTFEAGTAGVPTAYTIKTKGPDSSNISLEDVKQVNKEFGKNSNNVTGTFLQSYDLSGTNLKVSLQPKDNAGRQYAVLDNVTASLKLTYKNGKTAPNGGYSWTDTSTYENITLNMTAGDGDGIYRAGVTPLLAGTYSAAIEVKVGKNTTTKNLSDISAYSKLPDVTMALADGTPTTVTVNADAGTATSTNTFTANNAVVNDGHSAVLFASYRPFTAEENPGVYNEYNQNGMYAEEFAHYEMPELKFTLTDLSTPGVSVEMQVSSSGSVKLENGKETTKGTQIGAIEKGSEGREGYYEYDSIIGGTKTASCTYSYNTEKPQVIGEKEIQEITVTSQGVGYSLKLKTPLTIVQKNVTVPSISFVVDNDKFVTPATKESTDGRSFTYVLPKELVAEAGGNKVTEQVTTVTSETETTGDDPDTQVHDGSHPITKDNMNWGGTGEINRVTSSQKVYTVTNGVVTGKHTVASVFEAEYYKRHITTQLYTINERVQSTSVTISVTGTTTEIKTETTDEMTISLDYWMVNGERCEPGAEVKVSGNSVATPVYKIVQTPVRKLVTTTTVIGETDYSYRAECTAQETADGGAGNEATGTKEFCTHSTRFCKKNKGDKTAAMNDSSVKEPTNPGYTKVSSATAGIVRDVSNSKWERYGDPIVKSGSTTVSRVCYDGNGNVLWSE